MWVRFLLWLRKTSTVWILILAVSIVVGTLLALDGSMTLAERIEPYQQSGLFP
jgi:hypothetical protein